MTLISNSSTAFNIGTAGTNGVGGALTANAGTFGGAGGSITVTNNGGGVTLGALSNLSVTPTNGSGGTINLNGNSTSPGVLTLPSGNHIQRVVNHG